MYHIFLDEEAANDFALRLLKSAPFRDGIYTLYADVPVKCLGYASPYFNSRLNLRTMDAQMATQTVDFIVSKGSDIMLGITTEVMAEKSRQLFKTVLKPLSHIEVMPGGSLPRKYRSLYHRVRDRLEELEENPYPCFSLTSVAVEQSEQELKEKRLLGIDGRVTGFGRAHGLFFRYCVGEDDTLERKMVTSAVAFQEYLKAANWGGFTGDFDALQTLLDASMGDLYRNHSEQWNELNDVLAELSKLKSYPERAYDTLLEECLELVYRMRLGVMDGNPENRKIMDLTERLLICIAEVLSDERTAERFAVLRMPLHGYFEEAALRSGLYYPEWLYHHAVRPFLNEDRFYKTHTLQDLLLNRSALPGGTPFPDLMELLVLPLCTPKLEN